MNKIDSFLSSSSALTSTSPLRRVLVDQGGNAREGSFCVPSHRAGTRPRRDVPGGARAFCAARSHTLLRTPTPTRLHPPQSGTRAAVPGLAVRVCVRTYVRASPLSCTRISTIGTISTISGSISHTKGGCARRREDSRKERRRPGRFQPLRRLFGRRKKTEAERGLDGAPLKASFSTGEVCNGVVSAGEDSSQRLRGADPVLGSRALSHDSIFTPEAQPSPDLAMSQENISDKVRNLQRQIAQGIKFGQRPPSLRRSEGDEGSSDEEEVPQSPLKVSVQVEVEPAEPKVQQAEPPSRSPRSRRVVPATGTIESINLDAVPQAAPRLDNTAARHKLSVKPKNQRLSRKHLRFTQEGLIPAVVKEEPEEQRSPERLHEEDGSELEEEEGRKRAAEELRLEEERCRKQREDADRRRRWEEEERRVEEEGRRRREEEERKMREEERRKQREEEEEEERRQQELNAERKRRLREEEEDRKREEEVEKRRLQEFEAVEERMRKEQEEQRKAEELRWREMEERQRPFSFKVSSGEKQILFQKVHLTPVTPASSQPSGSLSEQRDGAKASSSCDGLQSPNLPTSPYVPHTAILVTGAQLCGTAVNLDQIRDSACMSLLGLGDDRKPQGTPASKCKTSPDRKSGKTKSLNESSLSTDQSVLAEWASIRSKIFKGVEEGKYDEYPETGKSQPSGEDPAAFPHTNLRKTMSASAKFSITPAKKKFGDSNRNSEVFGADDKEAGREADPSDISAAASPGPTSKPQNRTGKSVRVADRGSDECMFAKDLPSFLVPNPRANPDAEPPEAGTSEGGEGAELPGRDGEDMPSPFGIKLRRTNFSLRFHSEQSVEKRKKRYSAGDSFDGVPSPLTPIEPDSDVSSVFSDKSTSPTSPQRDGVEGKHPHVSASHVSPRATGKSTGLVAQHGEGGKVLSKPPVYRRPNASPKPGGAPPTPPPSQEAAGHKAGGSEEPLAVAQLHRGQIQGEEEPKEKRSFFPSINIPWREKTDRKTELKKDKPSLQSRHSLDGSKGEGKEAAPLWITLALQKQKGFREQQQNREEQRSHRDNKAAEKQTRERDAVAPPSPTETRGSGGPSPNPPTPEEPRRPPDSLLGRFERREHLKKANTLPSSVTVEIADSTPSPPAVTKRFPPGDSPQVSTEPAWLALAKRKAKAWSDCPQIIK
ncbi:capping protein inhibiting regulator of actin dynamics isoform 2-T2 [Spinachia spinachia]